MSETSDGVHPDRVISNTPSSGEVPEGARRRGRNNRRGNRPSRPNNAKFEGKIEALKDHVFDATTVVRSGDLFATTLKEIGEYIAREYDDAGEFRTALVDMSFQTLARPPDPDPNDALRLEEWKIALRANHKKLETRNKNVKKAFALVLGQCSRTIRDRIEAHEDWATINQGSDLMGLLGIIQNSMYTRATRRKDTQAMLEAAERLAKFKQTERMSNSDF